MIGNDENEAGRELEVKGDKGGKVQTGKPDKIGQKKKNENGNERENEGRQRKKGRNKPRRDAAGVATGQDNARGGERKKCVSAMRITAPRGRGTPGVACRKKKKNTTFDSNDMNERNGNAAMNRNYFYPPLAGGGRGRATKPHLKTGRIEEGN